MKKLFIKTIFFISIFLSISLSTYAWDRDLVISSVIQNTQVEYDQPINVSYLIENTTSWTNVYNDFYVTIYYNGNLIRRNRINTGLFGWIYPKSQETVSTQIVIPSTLSLNGEGELITDGTLTYYVDSDNENYESNENNNIKYVGVSFINAPNLLPDLQPTEVIFTNETFTPGEYLSNCQFKVKNLGYCTIAGFNTKMYVSETASIDNAILLDNPTVEDYYGSISANSSNYFYFSPHFPGLTAKDKSAYYKYKYLIIVVDPDNLINELNESNNIFYINFGPDFRVISLTTPSKIYTESSFHQDITIANYGLVYAKPYNLIHTWRQTNDEGFSTNPTINLKDRLIINSSFNTIIPPNGTANIGMGLFAPTNPYDTEGGAYYQKVGVLKSDGTWSYTTKNQTIVIGKAPTNQKSTIESQESNSNNEGQSLEVNPSIVNKYFKISGYSSEYIGSDLKIISTSGKEVYRMLITEKETRVENLNLSSGVYIVNIISKKSSISKKIIVK